MVSVDTEVVNDLKSKVNIADLISQYVALSRTGKNYIGLCPFHGEKTPSFNVNAEKGFYHCFGCGRSGDAIEFLKEYNQVGFIDAVKELANFAGVTLDISNDREEKNNPNAPLYEINNQAARLYNILLMSTELGERARDYLAERGITDDVIKRFNIGLAPEENDFIFKNLSNKFDEEVMANSGLFHFSNNRVFDAFTNRIMFPITNEYGQTIGFSGRKWQENDDSKAKYINTSATTIFDKSYELWNLDKAKPTISKRREVYLMEGFMDVIAAHKAGINNVVASMGTALTEKHVRRLKQIAKKFVLVYDGDSAGQNAIYKALNLVGESDVQIVKVPEGLDPDEYSKTYGLTGLSALMETGRIQPIEFLIDFLRPENLANLQVQLDFIEQIAPMIAKLQSITAQDAYIRKLVEILPDFEYNQVEQAVNLRRENMNITDHSVSDYGASNLVENFADERDYSNLDSAIPIDFEEIFYENNIQPQVADRRNEPAQVFQPTIQVPKLSRSERAEEMLLHRMIYHSSVLKKFSQDDNFRFVHKRYQDIFEKILLEAMVYEQIDESHLASELSEDQRSLFYQIISLDLPETASSQEINDLVSIFSNEMEQIKFEELQQQLATAEKAGNKERMLELTLQIINQKKKL
ncbi:DNA primase [Lactococcus cremoris subsp. cremoris UC509.9]|uniref:DNA primase n=1 Tax=Lactococcus lactis subsp. cremoris TaxID=1359 RepID=A0AAJ6MGM7_LACLC|nr:DNA primase [Lactococcus cremoris]AFW91181.1 DNA primase [Lactococcus cremoris subsp. cremoris UC509.9]ARD90845.1 DNA primase [Lactococcus cremoris]MRM69319.1 DNA primase [Lactococcus cremoris]QJD19479.1 DNA primase [Lactococcus cremoris]QRZ29346.1 DNA primase [Lactococcus cremoris]